MVRSTTLLVASLLSLLPACGRAVGFGSDPTQEPAELELVFDQERYEIGDRVEVAVRNQGSRTFTYNVTGYEACGFRYTDATGRRFIIPEGTHCDTIMMAELGPGQTVTLFTWGLEECLVDSWGCMEEAPLPPGTYSLSGKLRALEGKPARVSGTVTIVAAELDDASMTDGVA